MLKFAEVLFCVRFFAPVADGLGQSAVQRSCGCEFLGTTRVLLYLLLQFPSDNATKHVHMHELA